MNGLRIIHFAHRRLQRLGFIKYIVSLASTERPTTLAALGNSLVEAINKTYKILPSKELQEYAERVFTQQHYAEIRAKINEASSSRPKEPIELELQDVYLCSDQLPSKRGRLVTIDSNIFPNLAVSLGFLLPDTFFRTSRGRLLINTIESKEIEAFNLMSSMNPLNPFIISPKQKTVFLFSFLQADGDLLRLIYPILKEFYGEITDVLAGDIIGEQLFKYLNTMEKVGVSIRDKKQVYRLRKTVDKIIRWKDKPYSGKGARDEWATLRLEPFVDLGIFNKKDPFSYIYELTEEGREFIGAVSTNTGLDEYLESKFMCSVARLLRLNPTTEYQDTEVIQALAQANNILRNNIGYSDITDTCLLACIHFLIDKGRLLEVGKAIDVAKRAQKENPRNIHFNVDRWGKLKFISFAQL